MATPAMAQAELFRLRQTIADIEGRLDEDARLTLDSSSSIGERSVGGLNRVTARSRIVLGISSLDLAVAGGLPLATLHEIRTAESRDGGAASGFALALIARFAAEDGPLSIAWISEAEARRETGLLYAPGLTALGINPASVIEVSVRTQKEALWAFEAALSCPALKIAVCELRQASLDLSATRRCVLRAREGGATGFLLRLGNEWAEPSAAELRFVVSPQPAGVIGGFAAGVGRMAWRIHLEKNRLGPTGAFIVEWNAHERCFVERRKGVVLADPQPFSAAPLHQPASPRQPERDVGEPGLRRAS